MDNNIKNQVVFEAPPQVGQGVVNGGAVPQHSASLKHASGNGFDKAVRVATIAPLMGGAMILFLYIFMSSLMGGWTHFAYMFGFITIFPMLSYPIHAATKLKSTGRKGQRDLAILMAGIGYALCVCMCLLTAATKTEWLISLTYLFSGLLIILFNLIGLRASGHACGAAGPIAMLIFLVGGYALLTLPLLVLVYISSIRTKRHTGKELILGTLSPILAMSLAYLLQLLIPIIT